jgi:hypothetical protein
LALITSYATLQSSLTDFLHRSDLSTVDIELIDLAEKRIQREVRTPDMETALSVSIASGVIAVPTDFLEWKAVYVVGSSNVATRLEVMGWEELLAKYPLRASDGLPKFIARNVTNFEFGPWPDSTYAVKGTYYKRLASVASSWNALATANPDLYLYASLAASAAYIQDDARVPLWEQAYQMTRDAVNSEGLRQNLSGSLRMRAG